MKKKLLSLCLALVLCVGLAVPAAAGETAFADVPEDADYADAVRWAAETGITKGKTAAAFAPDEVCTRGQAAVFLWRIAGSPEPALTETQFVDVTDPAAYNYKAIQWAAEMDMEHFGEFWPHDPCSRLDAVYFLWRAAGSPEMEGEMPFTDMADTDGGQPRYLEQKDAVLWAAEQGVMQGTGCGTTFSPDKPCTRAQIVTFLYRAFA